MVQRLVTRVLSLSVVAGLILCGCAGIKAQTNSYASLAEAREGGAVANGWIPDGLPSGSHDIREGHVPGTTQHWGIFEYPQAEEGVLRALLEAEEVSVEGLRCEVPARIQWWPLMLRGALDGPRLATTGTRLYRAKNGGLLFAVNWSQGRAYYWSQ